MKYLSVMWMLILSLSCVTDEAARYYSSETYAPKEADEIDVFYDMPDRPYEIIADFQARNATVNLMKIKAGEIGADGIVVRKLGGLRSVRDQWASEDRSNTYSRLAATAIKYVGDVNP